MSKRPGVFNFVLLPGIVAGMLLAGVALVASDALFPDAFQFLFPRKTPFFILVIAITLASTIGFLNLVLPTKHSKNKDNSLSGGGDAL
jgi:hypothetical protein